MYNLIWQSVMWRPRKERFLIGVKNPLHIPRTAAAALGIRKQINSIYAAMWRALTCLMNRHSFTISASAYFAARLLVETKGRYDQAVASRSRGDQAESR
jgi:hypothetical protein